MRAALWTNLPHTDLRLNPHVASVLVQCVAVSWVTAQHSDLEEEIYVMMSLLDFEGIPQANDNIAR